jgi:hypothetical protein
MRVSGGGEKGHGGGDRRIAFLCSLCVRGVLSDSRHPLVSPALMRPGAITARPKVASIALAAMSVYKFLV